MYCLEKILTGRRGYAPSSKLIRYHQAADDPPPSPHPSLSDSMTGIRRHSYTPESRPLTTMSKPCFQVIDRSMDVFIDRLSVSDHHHSRFHLHGWSDWICIHSNIHYLKTFSFGLINMARFMQCVREAFFAPCWSSHDERLIQLHAQ